MDVCMYSISTKTEEGFGCKKLERTVRITERFGNIEQNMIFIVLEYSYSIAKKITLTNTTFSIYSKRWLVTLLCTFFLFGLSCVRRYKILKTNVEVKYERSLYSLLFSSIYNNKYPSKQLKHLLPNKNKYI